MHETDRDEFKDFVLKVEPGLRRAFFAVFGLHHGRDATAGALAWAWENWPKVKDMANPTGYLFRVGQSQVRTRKVRPVFVREEWHEPLVEPRLGRVLADLSEAQRTAVILVYGFEWTMSEVAALNGTKVTSVQTHLERGLRKLRSAMGVEERA
jgi:DNA-directed RNA polymerase specialized sigma24 family protein